MPAEGAMATRLEAPAEEPRSVEEEAVRLEEVTRRYPRRRGGPVVALEGFDLSVRAGEVVPVVGPSGGGKTTLRKLVACLQRRGAHRVLVAQRRSAAAGA